MQPIQDSQSKDELREPPRLERARGLASLRQHASSRRFEGSVRPYVSSGREEDDFCGCCGIRKSLLCCLGMSFCCCILPGAIALPKMGLIMKEGAGDMDAEKDFEYLGENACV